MEHVLHVRCVVCGKEFSPQDRTHFECDWCEGPLDVVYDYKLVRRSLPAQFRTLPATHWKYAPFFPVEETARKVTLGEGGTPLVAARNDAHLLFKVEGQNPTGSFKDRGSALEIARALSLGIKEVACATTGNMGASVSTYAACAGIRAHILVTRFTQQQKLDQIRITGADVRVAGATYVGIHRKVLEIHRKKGTYLCGDYAWRGEGQKSVAFEIADQLFWKPPRNIIVPVGNATMFSAVHKAFEEMRAVGLVEKIPRIVGVEASGCDPLMRAWERDEMHVEEKKKAHTIASAILCEKPVDAPKALFWLDRNKGEMVTVTDAEMMKARSLLGRQGLYVEPSSATVMAAYEKLNLRGTTVCVLTGHGLKG